MDKYSFDDLNSVWMKQIKRHNIEPEEEGQISAISSLLISEISNSVHNVVNRIIYKELVKRPKATLEQQLLIKRQVESNVSENITNIAFNMAKEKLDIIKTEPELIVVEQVQMNCDNFDLETFNDYYSFLDEESNNNQDDFIDLTS